MKLQRRDMFGVRHPDFAPSTVFIAPGSDAMWIKLDGEFAPLPKVGNDGAFLIPDIDGIRHHYYMASMVHYIDYQTECQRRHTSVGELRRMVAQLCSSGNIDLNQPAPVEIPGLALGDVVTVSRRVVWQDGWKNMWTEAMDAFVGHQSRIQAITDRGVFLAGCPYAFPSNSIAHTEAAL